MDAVAEARTHINATLKEWAVDGKTLLKTARELGVDTGPVIQTLSGQIPVSGARSRARPARTRTRSNGQGTATGEPTGEQILAYLRQSGPGNQSQLAARFHTSRQTIAKRLDTLVRSGDVVVSGAGSQKLWAASPARPAGQGFPAAA